MNDSKMEFGFNEERIIKDDEYTVEEIWKMLNEVMNERHLYSTSQGLYEVSTKNMPAIMSVRWYI